MAKHKIVGRSCVPLFGHVQEQFMACDIVWYHSVELLQQDISILLCFDHAQQRYQLPERKDRTRAPGHAASALQPAAAAGAASAPASQHGAAACKTRNKLRDLGKPDPALDGKSPNKKGAGWTQGTHVFGSVFHVVWVITIRFC